MLRVIPLEGEITLGRDPTCTIQIDSLAIAPRHLSIRPLDDGYLLRCLTEDAEIRVNGEPCTEHRLHDGDLIQVGKHQLRFLADPPRTLTEEAPAPAAQPLPEGWFQVMTGSRVGRTLRLDSALTRVGRRGRVCALVARRREGYFVSQLDGDNPVLLNGEEVGDRTLALHDGDLLSVGHTELLFFQDTDRMPADRRPAGVDPDRPHRRFTRIAFEAPAKLHLAGRTWVTRVIDLSLKGALVETPDHWPAQLDGDCWLWVFLTDQTSIEMRVTLAHAGNGRLGFRCEDIDVESVSHLRRLVAFNLGDDRLLQRELGALGC